MPTASARSQRLLNLADTTGAIADALTTRAGWMDDEWATYSLHNAVDWRFDYSDLPGALRAWAQTLRAIGEFTGSVGNAFLEADDGDHGGVHEVSEHRLLDLVPCDVRQIVEDSTATEEVDWGDPDDPPDWLEDLDFSAQVVSYIDHGASTLEVSFVVGTGSAAGWSPRAPAVLGRFATPAAMRHFSTAFTIGSAGLSGLSDGAQQAQADATSLSYTDGEIATRATVRGIGTAGGAVATGLGGAAAASSFSWACGPAAPACAGVIIVGSAWGGEKATDAVLDWVLGRPDPAEHDPDIVRDHVDSVAPGTLLRDIPDETWDVIEPLEQDASDVGATVFEDRHPYLDTDALLADPSLVTDYELPPAWVRSRLLDSLLPGGD